MIPILTKSENEVIKLKCLGFIDKEIAVRRFVSPHTVRTLIKRAIKKTGVKSCYELVARYAQSNPNLFRNIIVGLFVSIQGLIVFTPNEIDLRRSRNTTRIVRLIKK